MGHVLPGSTSEVDERFLNATGQIFYHYEIENDKILLEQVNKTHPEFESTAISLGLVSVVLSTLLSCPFKVAMEISLLT